jgi:hypothetical protein
MSSSPTPVCPVPDVFEPVDLVALEDFLEIRQTAKVVKCRIYAGANALKSSNWSYVGSFTDKFWDQSDFALACQTNPELIRQRGNVAHQITMSLSSNMHCYTEKFVVPEVLTGLTMYAEYSFKRYKCSGAYLDVMMDGLYSVVTVQDHFDDLDEAFMKQFSEKVAAVLRALKIQRMHPVHTKLMFYMRLFEANVYADKFRRFDLSADAVDKNLLVLNKNNVLRSELLERGYMWDMCRAVEVVAWQSRLERLGMETLDKENLSNDGSKAMLTSWGVRASQELFEFFMWERNLFLSLNVPVDLDTDDDDEDEDSWF